MKPKRTEGADLQPESTDMRPGKTDKAGKGRFEPSRGRFEVWKGLKGDKVLKNTGTGGRSDGVDLRPDWA